MVVQFDTEKYEDDVSEALICLCQHFPKYFCDIQWWHLSWVQKSAPWTLCFLRLSWKCRFLCPLRCPTISSQPRWISWKKIKIRNNVKEKTLTGSRSEDSQELDLQDLCIFSTLLWTLLLWVLLRNHQVCWGSKLQGSCLRFHFSGHLQKYACFELCFQLCFDTCFSMRRQTALQRKNFIN